MLNKDICKRCHDEKTETPWNDASENSWRDKGWVWCYIWKNKLPMACDINDAPPVWCPYATEHIVSEDAV